MNQDLMVQPRVLTLSLLMWQAPRITFVLVSQRLAVYVIKISQQKPLLTFELIYPQKNWEKTHTHTIPRCFLLVFCHAKVALVVCDRSTNTYGQLPNPRLLPNPWPPMNAWGDHPGVNRVLFCLSVIPEVNSVGGKPFFYRVTSDKLRHFLWTKGLWSSKRNPNIFWK